MVSLKSLVAKLFGKKFYDSLKKNYYIPRYRYLYPIYLYFYVKYLKRKKVINVVFIASTLSMWRYQRIYELLAEHPRFNASIVIIPFASYSQELQQEDIAMLKSYFDALGISYRVVGETVNDIRKELAPDVIFYPQPYNEIFSQQYNYNNFIDKLLCYSPYAFWMSKGFWSYNFPMHNYAWKLFYSTELHRKDAQAEAYNKGRNVEVVGYTNADNFLADSHCDVWKPQKVRKKKIIWAPHYTIFSGELVEQSNFLWMAELMLELAKKYEDTLQFAFKPHPRLKSELYNHPDWGKQKTDAYYETWATQSNSQLETGGFIDLFMTSDAMIHDSGSFCVEYHYTKNPVMYVAKNFEEQVSVKGEFGQLAMSLHYVGKCKEDIIDFIENAVLKGEDPMKERRHDFYNKYLLPPNGKTAAENILDVLVKSLS